MGGSLDGKKGKTPAGVHHDNVFGPVPSRIEVQKAMSDLQSFMDGSTSNTSKSSECNQLNQMLNHDTRITQSSGYRRVQDAFHLLKTQPSVQKMVASISSDKAVWDAILSNKAVQDLQGSMSMRTGFIQNLLSTFHNPSPKDIYSTDDSCFMAKIFHL